ncbi:MAG: hypothetical protein A2474_05485 [Elusimicrobia bacterium RIFOXYC2_FULL_34_12]|nr:MAG: hypothetical protein A2474_05485 [Elusimicrobia bacterium RIFOXYC2_FULL_34_12]OGS38022.1 MAG: hypothetical protein A2551_05005 [Elusimicrobia bacterium RIFOXYD2_FULL_34_30]HAM38702.1 hypothetical protein [Elusimicrobiota bacterium]
MELELDIIDIQWAKVFLKKTDFLSQLTEQEITNLIYKIKKKTYSKNKTILFKGEFSNRLFIIKTGKVGIFISKEGKKEKVTELDGNHYFGEVSLIHPVPASATVVAESNCEILILDKEVLDEVFKNNPTALDTIHKKIEERKQT